MSNSTLTKAEKAAITRALNIIAEKAPPSYGSVTSPASVADHIRLTMTDMADDMGREHFMVVFLNAQNVVIESAILFSGHGSGSAVHPSEVARRALLLRAQAVVLAHNHPSNTTAPSSSDLSITKRIVDALGLFDIRVLDHVIIGSHTGYYSFAEAGRL